MFSHYEAIGSEETQSSLFTHYFPASDHGKGQEIKNTVTNVEQRKDSKLEEVEEKRNVSKEEDEWIRRQA